MSSARGIWLLALVLALATPAAAGPIYRWVDATGAIQYSDQPPPRVEASEPSPGAPAAERPVTVDELLTLSGIRAQLPDVISQFSTRLRPAQVGPGEVAVVDRVLAATFSADATFAAIRDEMLRTAEPRHLVAVAAWMRTPLGARVIAIESATSTPERREALATYAASLARVRPPATRLALVQRLDWLTGEGDLLVELSAATARSLAVALREAMPRERRMKPGQIERQVEALRKRVAPTIREGVLVATLFGYQPLSDDELRRYADFIASDVGRWYHGGLARGLSQAVRASADRAASQLVRAVPLERWAPAVRPPTAPAGPSMAQGPTP